MGASRNSYTALVLLFLIISLIISHPEKKEFVKKLENRSISKKRKKEIAKVPFIYYVSTCKREGGYKNGNFSILIDVLA